MLDIEVLKMNKPHPQTQEFHSENSSALTDVCHVIQSTIEKGSSDVCMVFLELVLICF